MAMIFIRRKPEGELLAQREEIAVYLYKIDDKLFIRIDAAGKPAFSCRPHRLADFIDALTEAQGRIGKV